MERKLIKSPFAFSGGHFSKGRRGATGGGAAKDVASQGTFASQHLRARGGEGRSEEGPLSGKFPRLPDLHNLPEPRFWKGKEEGVARSSEKKRFDQRRVLWGDEQGGKVIESG